MPLRALARLQLRLSASFYRYGKACSSRPLCCLLLSLLLVSLLSYTVVLDCVSDLGFTHLDSNDAYFWQHSPHVKLENTSAQTTSRWNVQQIRLANHESTIDSELLHHAQQLQNTLTTSVVHVDGKAASLASICLQRHGQCVIHSPLDYWKNEITEHWIDEVQKNTETYSNNGLSMHPLSVFGNATFDRSRRFVSADALILTLFLKPYNAERVWAALWEHAVRHVDQAWQKQLSMHAQTVQYQFKLFPHQLPEMYICLFVFVAVSYIVSNAVANAHLLRSQFGLGLAAVFMASACFTTTVGLMDYFQIWRHMQTPWYLLIIVPTIASLENVFLLTNAMLSAGCDMHIKEKVGRGLESVGVPMTTMLAAELIILAIGDAMHISLVSDFCRFARVALLVGYLLEMTFFISILAINVKCVELTDLDDRQTSKRLRELAKYNLDADSAPDSCPIQEPINDSTEPKTCAECKQFKTHRTVNAIVLCLIILSLFRASSWTTDTSHNEMNRELKTTSTRFWNAINPTHEPMLLQVNPPYLVLFTAEDASAYALELEEHYATKSSLSSKPAEQSRFRQFLFESLKRIISLILRVNVPSIMLCIVLVGIILWLKPSSREQIIRPLLAWAYLLVAEQCIVLIRGALLHLPGPTGQRIARELGDYDENGVHRGAILTQERFNQQQLTHSIQQVDIRTLSGQHVADVRKIAINAKHGCVVSCGQDGRIVLWDANQAEWMARLDCAGQTHAGAIKGDLNPEYFPHSNKRRMQEITGSARCVKIDQGNKWIGTGFDDGMIRIWDMDSGNLLRELYVDTVAEETIQLRHRRKPAKPNRYLDRVIAVQFVGQVTEYCHPLVAQAAAKQAMSDSNSTQNYLVSVHKSGVIREWDIPSGECIQSIQSDHGRDITILHVVESKAPHRKLGVTWIFTASKDGIVKCWERRLIKVEDVASTSWTCAYTIDGHGSLAITALATELPVGGMGVLVTGASDGTVKVWNFETGENVCTLSTGRFVKQKQKPIAGGPLLRFSKMSSEPSKKHNDSSDHRGPITQVVVARYCEVENGPGLCRGCDTCFGNGFFVASCSMDESVHAWRLERADGNHENSCSLCTKDYHQKQYRPRNDDSKRQRRTSSPRRPAAGPPQDGLLDIEQLGGENNIALTSTYLGVIEQLAGRGLVFCNNMVLAGVRRKTDSNDWEAWFASLKYYDPSINQQDVDESAQIPVETFDLDKSDIATPTDSSFWSLFGEAKQIPQLNKDYDSDDEDEANELLPFSTVRHLIPLNGSGMACDYGNYIKLVYLDDRCRKRSFQANASPTKDKKSCCSGKSGAQCCGGKNKVNGKCCGGKGRVKREKTRSSCNVTDCSSIADCPSAADCSRASECSH